MEPSVQQLPEAGAATPVFEAYTAFPGVEQAVEQVLGPQGKFVMSERSRLSYVRFLPWIALIFLPLHIAAVLLLLGISALATLVGSTSFVGALISAGVLVLDIIALPGLFARSRRGWAFFTYAVAIGALRNVLSMSLFGLLTSALVLWLAFQVKYEYR